MRIAVVHDWLVAYAGAEKVLEQILLIYPQADLFSMVDFLPMSQRKFLHDKFVKTSFIQRLPKAKTKYRQYLPLMTVAVEQFDLSRYDLVLSSSHAVAKGVITGPDQLHISYVHSPMRYAWDLQHQYLRATKLENGLKSFFVRFVLHYMRMWDVCAANRVDEFIVNSHFIARRVERFYRRMATVIYPPVDVDFFGLWPQKEKYYVTLSRFVPYKKIDLIVEAFAYLPNQKLIVIGDGPDRHKILSLSGKNVELVGYQPQDRVREYLQRAKAFLFAAEEDFGIAVVEAQACGTPVIAYGKGGALETVVEGKTGIFFAEQRVESLIKALENFEKCYGQFDPYQIRRHAEQFSKERFQRQFKQFVESSWERFQERKIHSKGV